MTDYRITTLDNPHSPFTEYDDWYDFDESHGYCTTEYLARIAMVDFDMPDAIFNEEYDRAVNEISDLNALGIYKKVTKADYEGGKWQPINLDEVSTKVAE